MIGRVLLAAILAGLAAGLIMGVIQHVRVTPLILHAETFEGQPAGGHDHGTAPAQPEAGADSTAAATAHEHEHGEEEGWMPADGLERTLFTTMASMLAGAGFALALTGISFMIGLPVTRENGWIWGLCGFLAVSFAPALGLAPELPGMPAADLGARQLWWVGTVAATGAGLYLLATRRTAIGIGAAIVLFLLPHLIGAPKLANAESAVPAELAAEFAANSLGANLIMWVLIGVFLAIALTRAEGEAAKA